MRSLPKAQDLQQDADRLFDNDEDVSNRLDAKFGHDGSTSERAETSVRAATSATCTSRERPILFSAPMVRAILDGRKTQTRRLWKLPTWAEWDVMDGGEAAGRIVPKDPAHRGWYSLDEVACPYGRPGSSRLWVRESFCDATTALEGRFLYRADGDVACRWTPSIHMPRWASRILLEVTGVRVERLQDISRGDAMEEGCPFPNMAKGNDPREWYSALWAELNGAGSWDANPWVWVVEFKRVDNA